MLVKSGVWVQLQALPALWHRTAKGFFFVPVLRLSALKEAGSDSQAACGKLRLELGSARVRLEAQRLICPPR